MTSIIYVGMDVHTTNFTLCCYTMDSEREFATVQTKPDYHEILKYMDRIQKQRGEDCRFVCGYEAGCLGYSLHNQLRAHGVDCVILAPSTMPQEKGKRIKTDPRDAAKIAKCLAFHLYSPVYVPDVEDDAVKEYGWSDSVSNLSNKLQRESLRYVEAVQLADALGYDIIWGPRKSETLVGR